MRSSMAGTEFQPVGTALSAANDWEFTAASRSEAFRTLMSFLDGIPSFEERE
jgi:hypothetical protein